MTWTDNDNTAAIIEEQRREIAELRQALNAILLADKYSVDENNAGYDAAQAGTERWIGEQAHRAQYPDRPLYDTYDTGYTMGLLDKNSTMPEDLLKENAELRQALADAMANGAEATEEVERLRSCGEAWRKSAHHWRAVYKSAKALHSPGMHRAWYWWRPKKVPTDAERAEWQRIQQQRAEAAK